jgi:hypothetical protein
MNIGIFLVSVYPMKQVLKGISKQQQGEQCMPQAPMGKLQVVELVLKVAIVLVGVLLLMTSINLQKSAQILLETPLMNGILTLSSQD